MLMLFQGREVDVEVDWSARRLVFFDDDLQQHLVQELPTVRALLNVHELNQFLLVSIHMSILLLMR